MDMYRTIDLIPNVNARSDVGHEADFTRMLEIRSFQIVCVYVLSRQKLTPHLNTTTIANKPYSQKNHTCSGVEYPRVFRFFRIERQR